MDITGERSDKKLMDAHTRKALAKLCERFVIDNRITCPESIYQQDNVSLNSFEFFEEMCNIIGYASLTRDSDEDFE